MTSGHIQHGQIASTEHGPGKPLGTECRAPVNKRVLRLGKSVSEADLQCQAFPRVALCERPLRARTPGVVIRLIVHTGMELVGFFGGWRREREPLPIGW
jgi:hypothetical protein